MHVLYCNSTSIRQSIIAIFVELLDISIFIQLDELFMDCIMNNNYHNNQQSYIIINCDSFILECPRMLMLRSKEFGWIICDFNDIRVGSVL